MPFHLDNVNLGGEGQIKAALQIGEDIRKWRQERDQTEKELGFADTVMKSAHTDGRISDEEYTDYLKMPEGKKHSAAIGQMANVADDFARQKLADQILARKQLAEERSRPWSPDPAILDRAQKMGLLYVPNSAKSGQYIDSRTREAWTPGAAAYDDEGNQLGVYDAKGKITKLPSAAKADPTAAMQEMMRNQELQGIDRQVAELQSQLASGNQKWGPDWNPLATPYADQLRGLLAKRAALTAGGSSTAPRQPAAPAPAPTAAATTMDDITGQTPLPGTTASPANAATPAPVPTATVVNNEQDYAAIPAGGTYVDARDGKLKRKKAGQ